MKKIGIVAAGLLGMSLMMSAPSFADQTVQETTTTTTVVSSQPLPRLTLRDVCYPATIQSFNADGTVTLLVYGSPITVQRNQVSLIPMGSNTIVADSATLPVNSQVMVQMPMVNGEISSINNGMVAMQTDNGVVYLPVAAFPAADMRTPVFVRLYNGDYARVPLRTALALQQTEGATIITTLPAGATVISYKDFMDSQHCYIHHHAYMYNNLEATGVDYGPRINHPGLKYTVETGDPYFEPSDAVNPSPSRSIEHDQSVNGDQNF
jgi:hypothetical protein